MSKNIYPSPNQAVDIPNPAERQVLLEGFAKQPEHDAIWETAYAWVKAEGDQPERSGTASQIPAEELIGLAVTVRQTDPAQRYDLMTDVASSGQRWFDIIEGFSLESVHHKLEGALRTFAGLRPTPFSSALDLATGTGKSLAALEQHSEHVVGVDRNRALLEVAQQRAAAMTQLMCADITALPFEGESFDLVSSLGIEGSLDKTSQIAFYRELGRVLTHDGMYVSAFYNYPNLPSRELAAMTETSKAVLADMICDTVSGGAAITERLSSEELNDLLADLGLQLQLYLDTENDPDDQAIIQIITHA